MHSTAGAVQNIDLVSVVAALAADGYMVVRVAQGHRDPVQILLELAYSLGVLFVPGGCDPDAPVIRTAPSRSRRAAPFDRPEAIGWHGDFSTHEKRPELSLVYITRPDPRGEEFGAWRLASVQKVISELRSTRAGDVAFQFLKETALPFAYANGDPPRWFPAIRKRSDERIGLRFYLPSIQRGCVSAYGAFPSEIEGALTAVSKAADAVGELFPTYEGSIMIASNWFALHDRATQSVNRRKANREALLCFVEKTHSLSVAMDSSSSPSEVRSVLGNPPTVG